MNQLTDLEYRVWTQYILSADDFGVMRATAVKLQADNDALAVRPPKVIQRCLDALVVCGLLSEFDHQNHRFVYQEDWQDFQKVTWPTKTINPPVPEGLLATCSSPTKVLFEAHPGGRKVPPKNSQSSSEVLKDNSESSSEQLSPTREWLTAKANGKRLMANGSEGGAGETVPPMDQWFLDLKAAYPPKSVSSGHLTMTAFVDAVVSKGTPLATFTVMLMNLESQKLGKQWLVDGMVPKLQKWLSEGLWEQRHAPYVAHQAPGGDKTAGNIPAIKAFVARRTP